MYVDFATPRGIMKTMTTRCSRCDAVMNCTPEGDCWCKELPALPMPEDNAGCMCMECLKNELKSRDTKVSEQI
jgi:hypothetical protein